ncbi:MAG: leucine-rich repeat protein, partial [Ruminococcus sp.]|nr:leucine-rich repeat protein [Ruminococcus sp.]
DEDEEQNYDDSVEGEDPDENETSYTAAEKAADENNFIAYQYCGNRLNWYVLNGELVIFGKGDMYDYETPSDAPWYERSFSKITIRHGVTSISENAFGETGARTIKLPSSVVEIGRFAFMNARSLESVGFGKDLKNIDEYAFYNCEKLADVTFNNNLSKIGVSAFENCTSLGDIRLPKTLKYIYVNSFKGCTSLCSVILRKDLLEIRESAFENCTKLKTINMPDTITSIHSSAFKNCAQISFDSLPLSVVTIGEYAFEKCSLLTEVVFPNKLAEVGTGAFKNSGIKTITIDSALKVFNTNMLSGCKNVVVNVKCNTAAYKAFKKVSGYTVNCIQHDNKALAAKPATFTKDGIASGYICQSCGEKTKYKPISHISTVMLKNTKPEYSGKPVQPKVVAYSADGKTISSKNYSVTYTDKRINIGKKIAKVVFKGDYSGSKTLYYSIVPQKPVPTKITAKQNGFALNWKKNTTQKDGYQIQYSKNKNFSGVTSVTVKGAKSVTKTVTKKGLSGKVYVRIRAYKKVSGTTYYSNYSKVMSVTIK